MPVLQKVDTLVVPLGYAYNIPWQATLGGSQTWSAINGQAVVGTAKLPQSPPLQAASYVCYRDHYVLIRTPTLPNQIVDLSAAQMAAGNQYGIVWQAALSLGDIIASAANMGVATGNPLTVTKALLKSSYQFDNGVNSTVIGTHRYGWKYGKPVLGSWRLNSLTPAQFDCYLSDGSVFSVPAGSSSSLDMLNWFDTPRGSVLPYQNGYVCQVRVGVVQVFVFFGVGQTFRQENVTLDGDPTANTQFQAVTNVVGNRTLAGSSGWIINLGPGTGIFPNQGRRFIYISKTTMTWRDIQLIATDATANARISNTGSESFNLCQSELDGLFYGKANNGAAISDQILVSPEPPQQILPKLVPMFGLPDYGVYDTPYGVTR